MVTAEKVGAIIQARVGSRRFNRKVLRNLPYGSGLSIIENIVHRARAVSGIDAVIVATSNHPENDEVVSVARAAGADVFRGSEDDVLERFHQAAVIHSLAHIVRLTADNPFVDPVILDTCLGAHKMRKADYTKTIGLPLGMNFEVITFPVLDRLQRSVNLSDEREHITLHINNNPSGFAVCVLDYSRPEYEGLRLTIDWEADYALACFIFEQLYTPKKNFNLDDVVTLLNKYPWAKLINSNLQTDHLIQSKKLL